MGLITNKKIVLFHGVLSAKQNYDAAQSIVESIAPKIPDVLFVIIGKNPPYLLEMKALLQKNVLVLREVQNIEDFIKVADICIAPIKSGSGTRLKVLEYLAARKPLVATFKAVEGLNLIQGVHGLLHNDVDDAFINSINNFLHNPKFGYELGNHAGDLAKNYDWSIISKSLYSIYSEMINNR